MGSRKASTASRLPEVTAWDVFTFVRSPFNLWADRFAPKNRREPLTPFQQILLERGKAHETETYSALYPDAEFASPKTKEEGFEWAIETMAEGTDVLLQGYLLRPREALWGRADVLERSDAHPSRIGD